MASKTIDHLALTVGVTPYEHEGNSYDALRVSVIYSKGYGFYVSWQPVKLTQYGYQTGPMPSQDPLVGGGRFIVDRVPKNNSKRLAEMHAALELAQEGIALYFDLRLWTQMEDFMRYVCLYGFTEHYRQQVENLKAAAAVAPVMRQYNDLKKKHPDSLLLFRCGDFYEAYEQDANDVVNILGTALSKSRAAGNAYDMVGFPHYALDAYLPKLVRAGKRVAICDQINENTNEKTLEDKTMTTKNNQENESVQTAQVNNNVTTEADVQEVDDIVPKVTAKPKAKPAEKPATTIPLGKHGTLVIAGVGGTKKEEPKANSQKPEVKVHDSVPQGKLQYVTYEVKKVNKATKKEYTVTGSKIVGFELTDPIYLAGPSFNGAIHTEQQDGKTVGVLRFSHKWTPAVKEVCDKLNAGGTIEDCVAIITGAKDARWQRIQERIAKREERKAQREAAKPKPAGEPAGAVAATGEKQYTPDEVAAMLKKVLAGGALPKDVEALMEQAA